jgi:hypothetical protein
MTAHEGMDHGTPLFNAFGNLRWAMEKALVGQYEDIRRNVDRQLITDNINHNIDELLVAKLENCDTVLQ